MDENNNEAKRLLDSLSQGLEFPESNEADWLQTVGLPCFDTIVQTSPQESLSDVLESVEIKKVLGGDSVTNSLSESFDGDLDDHIKDPDYQPSSEYGNESEKELQPESGNEIQPEVNKSLELV